MSYDKSSSGPGEGAAQIEAKPDKGEEASMRVGARGVVPA